MASSLLKRQLHNSRDLIQPAFPNLCAHRKASQYANSIDDVVRIFTTGNNGGYANDWLIGDTKTNEVAKLELGLKNYRVWRSKDTAIAGSNFASDPTLIAQETTFDINDKSSSPNGRRVKDGTTSIGGYERQT